MNNDVNETVTAQPMQITDDLHQLLEVLPDEIRHRSEQHAQRSELIEIVMDLGRRPEARFPGRAEFLSDRFVTQEDLNYCIQRVGDFGGDNRAGLEKTLHRISAIRNRRSEIIGLTCRVGRAIFGTIGMIRDLVESGRSILMLGRPGVGKTTALREIARVLADELEKRVIIIDTSNEIAGDGDIPHPAIGRARRMQVSRPEFQHQVMIEAVENHMPEVIVIDEIGTELEALAARTIAERGVQLVGTAHGNRIENLIKNPTLSDLVGGIQSVTLGDEEARRRGSQKSVLERKAPPTFDIAVEMTERQKWVVHEQVSESVDILLRGRQPNPQVRTIDENGKVIITQEAPEPQESSSSLSSSNGRRWRNGGQMSSASPYGGRFEGRRGGRFFRGDTYEPLPGYVPENEQPKPSIVRDPEPRPILEVASPPSEVNHLEEFDRLLNQSNSIPFDKDQATERTQRDFFNRALHDQAEEGRYESGPNGEELPVHLYPYGVSRQQLDQVIRTLELPIVLTKDIDSADMVLALRSHVKNHAKLRQMAKNRQVPVHTVKSNSIPQIAHALRRLLHLDDPSFSGADDFNLFYQGGDEDELEALEEARLAVEQIVIPRGQPVELLPRSAKVRKMQHELIEHYHLKSRSFGDEPNRRLRIYPA
ncbi:MAG: R3H domain-containing nucleic acid-binding protein [Leptolyngbyaceae cyanobacterium bins.59]|nr:R3H domain-containing nucleic acid-binding protein [Leptolyngbyaceae cyanobacterium bins.59]